MTTTGPHPEARVRRRLLPVLLGAALLASGCTAVQAQPMPPFPPVPPPRAEHQPPSPPGERWAWQPGHWQWLGRGYEWVPGIWVERPVPHVRWAPGHWAWRAHEGWVWIPGHWR